MAGGTGASPPRREVSTGPDPEFISLYEELKRLFDKKDLDEVSQEEMKGNIVELRKIHDKVNELNRRNELLRSKYANDPKYACVHKRILERGDISKRESQIHEMLSDIKQETDEAVSGNSKLMKNEAYFEGMLLKLVTQALEKQKLDWDPAGADFINAAVVRQYMTEFHGRAAS